MTQIRTEFLNWRPDAEDFGNDGLTKAQNVVHDTEGWRPIHVKTSTSFATTNGLAASAATILSLVAKPIGTQGDLLCAWISSSATPTLNVGQNGITMTSNTTGYPLSFATLGTSHEIYAFDVTETSDGRTFFTVEARQTETGGTVKTLTHCGYLDDVFVW